MPIEYKQRLFASITIYCLIYNKLERLKVSLITQSLDNRIYKSNPQIDNFDDLPFYGDEMLIDGRVLYGINDNILFS